METELNQKAWDILNADEKLALTLKFIEKKSTWEAGEIMKKSHYKYLEIVGRAEKFLKIFTEHYSLYDDLVPPALLKDMHPSFREYLHCVILERLSPAMAHKTILYDGWRDSKLRDSIVLRQFQMLGKDNSAHGQWFYNLIMDFDRWNNWRISPPEIQEPHAFKRRRKNDQKRKLENSLTLGEEVYDRIKEKLQETRLKYGPWYFVVLCKNINHGEYIVVRAKKSENTLKIASEKNIYVFHRRKHAEEFIDRAADYFFNTHHRVRVGQDFWPFYREHVKLAANYSRLEGINEKRLHHLDYCQDNNRRRKDLYELIKRAPVEMFYK